MKSDENPLLNLIARMVAIKVIERGTIEWEKRGNKFPIGFYKAMREQGIFCHKKFEF